MNGVSPGEGPDRDDVCLVRRKGQLARSKIDQAGQGIHGLDAVFVGIDPGDQQGDRLCFQPADFPSRPLSLAGADVSRDRLIEEFDQVFFPLKILLQGGVSDLDGEDKLTGCEGQTFAQ